MKNLTIIFALAAICTTHVVRAQILEDHSTPVRSGELTMAQACDRAMPFIAMLSRGNIARSSLSMALETQKRNSGDYRFWRVIRSGDFHLTINAVTGVLGSCFDSKRQFERSRIQGRTNARCFSNQQEARTLAIQKGRSLGLPSSWAVSEFRALNDGEGGKACGVIGAVYKDSSGRVRATLSLDSQDGRILSYSRKIF